MNHRRPMPLVFIILAGWLALCACAADSRAGSASAGPVAADKSKAGKEAVYKTLQEAVSKMEAGDDSALNLFVGEKKGVVQQGDYVILSYHAKLADGTAVKLSAGAAGKSSHAAESVEGAGKIPGRSPQALVLAGDPNSPLGLGSRLEGRGVGSQGTLKLPPEQAFGRYDDKKIITIERTRTLPAALTMAAEDYFRKFRSLPEVGRTVAYNPYVDARVEKVDADLAHLRLSPGSEEPIVEPFGETRVRVDEPAGKIHIRLNPVTGAPMYQGRVVEVKEDKVVVDMNHRYVDEAVHISYIVAKIIKPSAFGNDRIHWLEDFNQGREASADLNRPILLFLYADWCRYCEKMFNGAFKDPWINYFKDEYVWVRINSDEHKAFMTAFGQKSFPLTVLMTPDGRILDKWSGYKKTLEVRQGLIKVLNNYNAIAG